MIRWATTLASIVGINRLVVRPLGQVQDHMRALGRLRHRLRVPQVQALIRAALGMATGSWTDTIAPSSVSRRHTSRLGESRTSSLPGLERDAENGDPPIGQRSANGLPGQVDYPGPAAAVDGVNLAEQVGDRLNAQARRRGPEGTDVLGQAAAAETQAR